MKKLIDTLYDLRLPQPKNGDEDEYKSMLDEVVKLETNLMNCQECKEIFDEFQTASGDLHSLACRNEFRRGFRAGALIVFEIFGEGANKKSN